MYQNLEEFIVRLEREGELVRITREVDPVYEIAEITDRVSKSEGGGKALLFENTGTEFPVLTNMMGSDRRIALALGVEQLSEIGERIDSLIKKVLSPKEQLMDKLRMLPLLSEMSRWLPRQVRGKGRCQEVVLRGDDARLSLLPILKCWPYDGGRFVTLPLVNTLDPDTGVRNVGMYRMQVVDDHTTGMHWHLHKTGERHYRGYERDGRRMPVSVCLGGDPAYTYAATAPMPDNMDEYLLAGFLRKKSVRLVKCITNDIYVPEDCDFVIEGWVDPSEDKFLEGPFGDHTGYYSLEDIYPYFHVSAITHRRGAIYPATLVGVPPQEDAYIAKATEQIFLAPIRLAIQPEVEDLYMPEEGVAHNIALLSINKTYEGQPLKVISSMWGAGQMMFNKAMVIAPAGVDLRSTEQLASLFRGVDVERDVILSRGVLDVLDHSTETMGVGGKLAFDLTNKRTSERTRLPKEFTLSAGIRSIDDSLVEKWSVLMLFCDVGVDIDIARFVEQNQIKGIKYIVAIDSSAQTMSHSDLLWFTAGNTEPERDVLIKGCVLMIDARSKVGAAKGYPHRWPNVVTTSKEIVELVDRRWGEYGLGEQVESPSSHYRTLVHSDGAEVKKQGGGR